MKRSLDAEQRVLNLFDPHVHPVTPREALPSGLRSFDWRSRLSAARHTKKIAALLQRRTT
jgi:hypothetical protein